MSDAGKQAGSLLWWGRSDREYSRNRVVLGLLAELGWNIQIFHPRASWSGLAESYLRPPTKPDMIWLPCFRQTDIRSAAHWAAKWRVPLIIDPLISAYQKEVEERGKWPADSPKALKKKQWESELFALADVVVADTPAHARYFQDQLGVAPEKLAVLYVAAEADHFTPKPFPAHDSPLEVLFFGSFLALQGVDVVVRAAKMIQHADIRWTLLGDGDLRPAMERRAAGVDNIVFEPWIDYALLPERLSRAHILLGIFGTTPKAGLVIPNKMFQAMAAGRPVITRRSSAYAETLAEASEIGWVEAGDGEGLAELVLDWARDPEGLRLRGKNTRALFERFFSKGNMRMMLADILERARRREK